MSQLTAEHMPSSTIRVGVDLVRVSDVAVSLSRFGDRYASRIFTATERAYCHAGDGRTAERFAARFAAKEAALKVLRPAPSDGIDFRSIEVRQTSEGACEIVLRGSALDMARAAGVSALSVSMSHDGDYATATVVAALTAATPNAEATQPPNEVHTAAGWSVRHRQTSWDA